MTEKDIIKLERNIDAKMKQIENKTLTPKESKIGSLFKYLQGADEVSYTKRIIKYKNVLKNLDR